MQRISGYAQQGNVTVNVAGVNSSNVFQGSYPGCTVSIFNQGTLVLATIYSDNGVTLKSNPFLSSSTDGSWFFYAASGRYDIQFSGVGITTPFTIGDVLLFDFLNITTNLTMQQPTAATAGANQSSFSFCEQGNYWTGAASATDQWCWQDVLGTGANPTSSFVLTHSGSSGAASAFVPFLNNTCYADQQAGADMGAKIAACAAALPSSSGGIIDATGFQGTQTWGGNVFSAINRPVLIKLGHATININVNQTPNSPNIRIQGAGGTGNGAGTCNTTLVKNFDGTSLFAPGVNGVSFELSSVCFGIGVTQTSGFIFAPVPGAHEGYVHNVHFQNVYGGFKLDAGSATPLNSWRVEDISANCSPNTVHTGTFLEITSSDNTVTSSGHIFSNWVSTGDQCIHDAAQFHLGSMADSPAFVNLNFSISRNNTSTQPNWLFDNTLAGGNAPRLVNLTNVYTEGDGIVLNDILKIAACTDCTFVGCDFGGGDHGVNITGGFGLIFLGGQIANNSNGGLYVTSAVANLGLSVQGVNFYGNSVTTTNTTDDIQIADGTSNIALIGNMFSQISSTVTANLTRWPINLLGTTSGQVSIHGNQSKTSKYGNTGLVRDLTAAVSGEIETDDGRSLVKTGSSGSSRVILRSDLNHPSFELGAQEQVSTCFSITPSTVNGGVTFTSPIADFCSSGFVGINGTLRNIAGTAIMGMTLKTGSGGGNYTGTNTAAFVSVDTTNLCTVITVPSGWKLKVDASGVLESITGAVAQSIALVDAGTTCAGGGVTALSGTRRDITPPALGTFDVNFHTQFILAGDGAAHSISLAALTSNAADAWGIQNTSATAAPSMTYTLMPSN